MFIEGQTLQIPTSAQVRCHVLESLVRYWPQDPSPIAGLPVCEIEGASFVDGPLHLAEIILPDWAVDYAVDGKLLVPREALPETVKNDPTLWYMVDWYLAIFLLLEAWHERNWEYHYGPIHSYSFRLSNWDKRAWQHAWVNRIALFLRRWAIHQSGRDTEQRLGKLPDAEYLMTHDVDAVQKTLPIRLKQVAFNVFNGLRALLRGDLRKILDCLQQTLCFLFGHENWWTFDELLRIEREADIKAIYNFYAKEEPKSPQRWLFDPSYEINTPKLRDLIHQIAQSGHRIGLHPGYESWRDSSKIKLQRQLLELASGHKVTCCRQHWLRFSWRETWEAQSDAGLNYDASLMFNDQPGFRNSSALAWQPWDPILKKKHNLTAQPTVLMDSHCYDYQPMSKSERRQQIQAWLAECRAVHGQIALLWHPHTLTKDYGWSDGFQETLDAIKANSI